MAVLLVHGPTASPEGSAEGDTAAGSTATGAPLSAPPAKRSRSSAQAGHGVCGTAEACSPCLLTSTVNCSVGCMRWRACRQSLMVSPRHSTATLSGARSRCRMRKQSCHQPASSSSSSSSTGFPSICRAASLPARKTLTSHHMVRATVSAWRVSSRLGSRQLPSQPLPRPTSPPFQTPWPAQLAMLRHRQGCTQAGWAQRLQGRRKPQRGLRHTSPPSQTRSWTRLVQPVSAAMTRSLQQWTSSAQGSSTWRWGVKQGLGPAAPAQAAASRSCTPGTPASMWQPAPPCGPHHDAIGASEACAQAPSGVCSNCGVSCIPWRSLCWRRGRLRVDTTRCSKVRGSPHCSVWHRHLGAAGESACAAGHERHAVTAEEGAQSHAAPGRG